MSRLKLKYLIKHTSYIFYKFHNCIFLSVLKKTNTLHIYKGHIRIKLKNLVSGQIVCF